MFVTTPYPSTYCSPISQATQPRFSANQNRDKIKAIYQTLIAHGLTRKGILDETGVDLYRVRALGNNTGLVARFPVKGNYALTNAIADESHPFHQWLAKRIKQDDFATVNSVCCGSGCFDCITGNGKPTNFNYLDQISNDGQIFSDAQRFNDIPWEQDPQNPNKIKL